MPSREKGAFISGRVFAYICVLFVCFAALAGLLQFSRGFFPTRAQVPSAPPSASVPRTVPPRFSRVIFVVIDALRADFVSARHSGFVRTKALVSSGHGMFFDAAAAAPTVTLPRIKAIVSGAAPTFADVLRNFGAAEMDSESFVAALLRAGRRTVFYGDDTWLKLFPRSFLRSEGTSSFFVTDTVTVDSNVTKHVYAELSRMEGWDAMILHYLGLDHIGHLEGPRSSRILPKQREYDEVLGAIYDAAKAHDDSLPPGDPGTLIVVCGDHGMSRTGNHGGSTPEELSTALIFFSPQMNLSNPQDPSFPSSAFQVDICPTLSLLLGLPIPSDNTGKILFDLFASVSGNDTHLRALFANAGQLRGVVDANVVGKEREALLALYALGEKSFKKHLRSPSAATSKACVKAFNEFLGKAGDVLGGKWGKVDWYRTVIGISLVMICVYVVAAVVYSILCNVGRLSGQLPDKKQTIGVLFAIIVFVCIFHLMYCSGDKTNSSACEAGFSNYMSLGFFATAVGMIVIPLFGLPTLRTFVMHRPVLPQELSVLMPHLPYKPSPIPETAETLFILLGVAMHFGSIFGSSLVEEEHTIWHFLVTTGLLGYLVSVIARPGRVQNKWTAFKIIAVLVLGRVTRGWNFAGDPHAMSPSNSFGGFLAENETVCSAMVSFSVGLLVFYTIRLVDAYKRSLGRARSIFLTFVMCAYLAVFVAKFTANPLPFFGPVILSRIVFVAVGLALVVAVFWPYFSQRSRADNPHTFNISALLVLLAFLPFVLLLHKRPNIPLVALLVLQAHFFSDFAEDIEDRQSRARTVLMRTTFFCWLSRAAFFALGNSNSIATIDISGAYMGQTTYNAVVWVQAAVVLYTGPFIFFMFALQTLYRISRHQAIRAPDAFEQAAITACFAYLGDAVLPLLASAASLLLQHGHLFVWSVFAPKFVYAAMDTAFAALACAALCFFAHTGRLHLIRFEREEKKRMASVAAAR